MIKVWNVDQLAKGCVDNFHGHTDRVSVRIVITHRVRFRITTADKGRPKTVTADSLRLLQLIG